MGQDGVGMTPPGSGSAAAVQAPISLLPGESWVETKGKGLDLLATDSRLLFGVYQFAFRIGLFMLP